MKTMRERILELALSQETVHAIKFKDARQCKEKVVSNAIRSYAGECSADDVLAIMDTTMLGSGRTVSF